LIIFAGAHDRDNWKLKRNNTEGFTWKTSFECKRKNHNEQSPTMKRRVYITKLLNGNKNPHQNTLRCILQSVSL